MRRDARCIRVRAVPDHFAVAQFGHFGLQRVVRIQHAGAVAQHDVDLAAQHVEHAVGRESM
jgi:hypothetical protein